MLARPNITLLKLIVLFVSTLLSHNLFAQQTLPEFNARYAVQKFGIKLAEATYQLSYTDTGYKFTQNTNLHGLANMFADDTVSAVSYVDETANALLLKSYTFMQTGREKNRDEDINIKWQTSKKAIKGKVTGTVRSKEINLEVETAVWDVLSFQIPLMIEFNKDRKEYPYKALLKGEIDTYNFVLTADKKISFAGKEYQVLQVVRTDPHKNRQLHIWLAPRLNNMPMIIENYRDGKIHSRMQLESVQFNNSKPITDHVADSEDDF